MTQEEGTQQPVQGTRVAIVGATGEFGQTLVRHLQPHAASIVALSSGFERPDRYASVQHFPNVTYEHCDISDASNSFDTLKDVDVVINASNLWIERDTTYRGVLVDGTKHLAHQARRHGVKRFIHIGALGSFVDARSSWLDYKYRSEDMAYAAFPDSTIVRPGLLFGHNSHTFNRLAKRMGLTGGLLCPSSLLHVQPVWEGDVAEAIKRLTFDKKDDEVFETVWDLGGPECYPVPELVKKVLSLRGQPSLVVPTTLNTLLWEGILSVTQMLPNARIPRDYMVMLKHTWQRNNIDGWHVPNHMVEEPDKHFTFKDLDIQPRSMDSVYAEQPQDVKAEPASTSQ